MKTLGDVVAYHASRPFSYAHSDCCRFAADVVRALRPDVPDFMRDWRCHYRSEDEADALMRKRGSRRLIRHLLRSWRALGARRCRDGQVPLPGDMAIIVAPDGEEVAGVVVSDKWVLARGENGVYHLPVGTVKGIWQCPRS